MTIRPLRGAGLALYRFREVPLVGRATERDALWAGLAQVHASGRPRALLVRGPSGVGKSRLVEWLATRSQELGAATVLRASHGPFGGAGDGLPRMLAARLQCVGLGGDEVFERVLSGIGGDGPKDRSAALGYEAAALTEYMLPGDASGERPRVRLAEQRERHAVLAGYLRRCTRERPALLWFEDAMWGPECLDFTRYLLGGGGPPVLVVLTVRDDRVAERPAEARMIEELAGMRGLTSLEVAPLTEAEHRALIGERLGLEGGLVEGVLARAGGNPLFSVQLVGDWVARGVLLAGPDGFSLAQGASLDLPDGMHALWQERLARLLAQQYGEAAAEARQALELAAALGLEVDPEAWAEGCAFEGITAPAGLVELLVAQRLAVVGGAGWAFVHGMLRESLEDLADAAGRRGLHHRCCAAILRRRHGAHAQGHAEALARHLIAAGDLVEAMAPLLDATYQMQLAGQYDRAERVLGEHAALADRVGLGVEDVRRLRGRMQAVWLTWMRGGDGSLALARARCREVEAAARRGGHDDVLGEALRWHGLVARFERRFAESRAALAQAAAAFERAGDLGGQARTALASAVTLRAVGELDAAEAELSAAERLARGCGLTLLLPRIAGNLAEIALQREDWGAAETRFSQAMAAAEASGDRKALALTLGGAGDLALLLGRLAAADEHYARAEALFASLGSRYVHGVRLHRATVRLLRGEPEAWRFLAEFVATPGRDPLEVGLAQVGLALAAGQAGKWVAFDAGVAAAEAALAKVGEARPVIVQLLRAAEAAARAGGEGERAGRTAALAEAQTRRLRVAAS
ncbi:MAG: AAA family ATPase [Nannocystis sp.]|uniref:ATP-binding protein n=1 Tax=Nannocystis sp. TaxID=1962667 RepID=UPI0024248BF6|nr:AAA family ATPase [Nannocystis sp.]MBK9754485.1 AAA family ATPase [Nannocystis sp.]